MPNKCNHCMQIKLCRKLFFDDGGYPNLIRAYEWICKDCDDYYRLLYYEMEKKRGQERKEWVIKRDKTLAQNKYITPDLNSLRSKDE